MTKEVKVTKKQTKTQEVRDTMADEKRMLAMAQNISTNYMSPVVWGQITGMAKTFIASGALPQHLKNAAQVVMTLQAGYEMGMKPMESIQSLYIVNGSVNIWGKAVVNRFKIHGYNIKYENETDTQCTAIVTGKGREKYEYTFEFSDAEKSGYTKDRSGYLKVGWKLGINRKRKLRYGALSMIIHTYIPHVLGGAQEIQEIFEDAMPEPETTKIEPVKNAVEGEVIKEAGDVNSFIAKKKKEKAQKEIDKSKKKSVAKTTKKIKPKVSDKSK